MSSRIAPTTAAMEPTIGWALDRAAETNGAGIATIDVGTGERRTWREVKARCDAVSAGLLALELEPGERVGVLMLNSARHLELWFAIPGAGMVMNDLNFRLAPDELRFICDDCDVRALFVDDTFLDIARSLRNQVDSLDTIILTGPPDDVPDDVLAYETLTTTTTTTTALPTASAQGLAAIFYTGGTTGRPKGAMLTHRNLTSNALHMSVKAQLEQRDRYLHAGPQFHLADGTFAYAITWIGGTHVFIPAFEPGAVIDTLAAERCTVALLVPTMIGAVVAHGGLADADTDELRLLLYGASPMPPALQRQAIEAFQCPMVQAYGMTEASPLVSWLDADSHQRGADGEEPHATRLASAGTPVPGVRAEVRRDDGTRADPGEAGEIWIQGPNITAGYWNRPEETAAALVDGWYRSGDIAHADDDGYLFIVDRAKDMIISGGENIYTTEVENAVYAHSAVAEAAVFGVPDDTWGELVHAEVVTRPGTTVTNDELVEHCRTLIAGYKLPRSVNIRADDEPLPKSGAGKILKRDLRDPYWEGRARGVN